MNQPVTSAQLESLRRYGTCAVANAIETFNVRLRNEGYTDMSVRCLVPRSEPMLGFAVTMRMKSGNPPTGKSQYLDRTDWWNLLEKSPAPRIVVIEDADETPGRGSLFGEMHSRIWTALGCIGAVTNGAVRDVSSIERTSFHLYAGGTVPSHGFAHIVEIGCPVKMAGLTIKPGDLLHGDTHGIVSVPHDLVTKIPAAAEEQLEHERRILALCRSQDFSVEKLREAMKPAR